VIDVTAQCGSTVALQTNLGEFMLDSTHLWYHGGAVEVLGIFSTGRKLSADNLVAFYEDLEDIEFECFTEWMGKEDEVEKPSMPELPMSYTVVRQNPCLRMVHSNVESIQDTIPTDVCTARVGANARRSKPGASEDSGKNWLISIDHVLVTETEQVTVSYLPNHPLQRLVQVIDKTDVQNTGNNTVTQYQLYRDDPARLYCQQHEVAAQQSIEFSSLHYLGSTTHEGTLVRKWASGVAATNASAVVDPTDENSAAIGDLPQDMSLEFGLANHMYVEFWDTDDGNHFPYYFGVHAAPSAYESTYYKSVAVGLTEEDVSNWKSVELMPVATEEDGHEPSPSHWTSVNGPGGPHRKLQTAEDVCRQGRNQIREGNFWFGAPAMANAFTEVGGDIDFYLERIRNGAPINTVAYQDESSYEGYWGLASYSFQPDTAHDQVDSAFLAQLIENCEKMGDLTNYTNCMEGLQSLMTLNAEQLEQVHSDLLANTTNSTDGHGRRLNSGFGSTICYSATGCLTGSLPDCNPPGINSGWAFDLDRAIPLNFDGIDAYFEQKDKYEMNRGSTYVKKKRIYIICVKHDDPFLRDEPTTTESHYDNFVTVLANQKSAHQTYFGFKVSGESNMLKKASFYQKLTGAGGITITKNLLDGSTSASGQGEIKYEAGRQICGEALGMAGQGRAGFILEGKVVVTSGSVSFEVSAGVIGSASIQSQGLATPIWDTKTCRCDGGNIRGSCIGWAGVGVSGKITVKFDKMWCGKTPEVSVIAEIKGELQLGPFTIGVGKTFDIVKAHPIGNKWGC
jgi:hypothetical protein